MADKDKQSRENKSIKKWFLIGATIVLAFLISYFTLTDIPLSDSNSLNKILLNEKLANDSYQWWNLLLILMGVTLLSVLYLAVINRLSGAYHSLTTKYTEFMDQITLSEVMISLVIIPLAVFALLAVIVGLSYNCCGWWNILSIRLSFPAEPLNLRYILIGIIGVATLIFTGWRTYIADQQKEDQIRRTNIEHNKLQIEESNDKGEALYKRVNENKEIDKNLYDDDLKTISNLKDLAIESYEKTQRCLDIICSCNKWMEGYIDKFVEKKRRDAPYSSLSLNEDNRIAKKDNQNKAGEITLLHEKRSQHALRAISHILVGISTNNPEQLKKLRLHNKMLCGISLSNVTLGGIDFINTCLVTAALNHISLNDAKLDRANLQGASLDEANLKRASLDGTNLQEAYLRKANLQEAYLRKANLQGAYLDSVNLRNASLRSTNLQGAYLDSANLRGAYLDSANLRGALLDSANLRGASLRSANLQGAYLDSANLQGAYLDSANLQGVFLDSANLQGASLILTGLQGSILKKANLHETQLIHSKLQGIIMDDVDLSNATLLDCNLYGATLKDIRSENILFNDIADIGYIKDVEVRKNWLNDICRDMKPYEAESFTQRMKAAWQAMENNQEPDGLDIIKRNSIFAKDSQGMYDISDEHLANLQNRWQKIVNETGVIFLHQMQIHISSLNRTTNKNVNLVDKLAALIDKLIASNDTQNNKLSHDLE